MNADQVRAYVNAKWPKAMQSPVALACATLAAADEANRAVGFASLQARATACDIRRIRVAALAHAIDCIDVCQASDIDYDRETLSHNVECNFPELCIEECDDIADRAISNRS